MREGLYARLEPICAFASIGFRVFYFYGFSSPFKIFRATPPRKAPLAIVRFPSGYLLVRGFTRFLRTNPYISTLRFT